MRRAWIFGCVAAVGWNACSVAAAEPLLPTADGTTWPYALSESADGVVSNEPRTLTVQITGTEEFERKQLLKLQTRNGSETVVKTELIEVNDRGIICHARAMRGEPMTKLEPAETLLAAPLQPGGAWESDGVVADVRLHQRFTISGEEDVYVPAGKFRAFHVHSDGAALMSISVDRWFAPGVGFVKDVTTARGPGGALLQRTTTELQKRPEVLPTPTPSRVPTPAPSPSQAGSDKSSPPNDDEAAEATSPTAPGGTPQKRLSVEVSDDAAGGLKKTFRSNVANIYVRWHAHGLPEGAKVRVAWVAEDVGGLVEPNFIVDQTETVAPASDSSARFTLGRPEDGWAEGKYRAEFYVNDQLEETVPVTITP